MYRCFEKKNTFQALVLPFVLPPLRNWPQLNPPVFFPPQAKVFKSLSSSSSRLPAMAPIQPLVKHGKCVASQMFCWDAYPLPWQIHGKAKMNREITFWKHESLLVGYFHWVKDAPQLNCLHLYRAIFTRLSSFSTQHAQRCVPARSVVTQWVCYPENHVNAFFSIKETHLATLRPTGDPKQNRSGECIFSGSQIVFCN